VSLTSSALLAASDAARPPSSTAKQQDVRRRRNEEEEEKRTTRAKLTDKLLLNLVLEAHEIVLQERWRANQRGQPSSRVPKEK
jgi:hypothetical protein